MRYITTCSLTPVAQTFDRFDLALDYAAQNDATYTILAYDGDTQTGLYRVDVANGVCNVTRFH